MTAKLKTDVTLRTDFTVSGHRIVDGQRIYAAQVLTPFSDAQNELRAGQVAVSDDDTHVKNLEDAIAAITGKIKVTVNNDGANETLSIDLDSTGADSGDVPTADGSGGWAWGAQQGMSGTPGSSTFRGLTDTPNDYSGNGGSLVRLNTGTTAIEFVTLASLLNVPTGQGKRYLVADDSGNLSWQSADDLVELEP